LVDELHTIYNTSVQAGIPISVLAVLVSNYYEYKERLGLAKPLRQRRNGRFLKGPIPWAWLTTAAQQPGKALHAAIVIWFLSGLNKSRKIALSGTALRTMGVNRHSGYRGRRALEKKAALITVERHPGRNPIVTILDGPTDCHE
jgi:hypothetical protein